MYFPALVSGLRRLGRGLVYELLQAVLWLAFWLRAPGGLRSVFGGGGALGALRRAGPAIRPRRAAGPARGGHFAQPIAA